ncbi:MAG: 2-oxo acid dehydrogenase subunit E2, partial [Candidatus Dadabacteria bacterium]|nr:2-oxo acid dehydrogenase subunit E2 [Candidatus Dadabacteria bacterium]
RSVMLEDEERNFKAKVPQQRPHLEVVERFGETHKSTPVAKRLADEHGISLLEIKGSGPGGRIIKADVERHIVEGRPKTAVEVPGLVQPLDQKRKYIVRKMVESKTTTPHYYLGVRVRMDDALALRREYNDTHSTRITITDFIIKSSAISLKTYPLANAHYESDSIKFSEHINIAVAVDTGDILLAPVIKNCESMTLTELSNTSVGLIEKARIKKLMPEDYEGGTFYISNIGNLGIEEIAPIIFPATSAILGVGAITKTPVVEEDDRVVVRQMMKIIISADHRILDGARAAEFLMEIKKNLENPLNLLT